MKRNTKKEEHKTRSYSLSLRLTPDEYFALKDLADSLGVSVSDVIRLKVFKGEFPRFRKERIEAVCSEVRALVKALNEIQLSIGDIARACEEGRVIDYQVLSRLENIEEQLGSLLLLVVKSFEELRRADSSSGV